MIEAAGQAQEVEARIRQAFLSANQKLPVIELATLAIVAMYGMYLLATGGVKARTHTVTREADGSFHEERSTTYAEAGGALFAITQLFRPGRRQDEAALLLSLNTAASVPILGREQATEG